MVPTATGNSEKMPPGREKTGNLNKKTRKTSFGGDK